MNSEKERFSDARKLMQVADWILETTHIIKMHVFADFGDTSSAQKKINELFSENKC